MIDYEFYGMFKNNWWIEYMSIVDVKIHIIVTIFSTILFKLVCIFDK